MPSRSTPARARLLATKAQLERLLADVLGAPSRRTPPRAAVPAAAGAAAPDEIDRAADGDDIGLLHAVDAARDRTVVPLDAEVDEAGEPRLVRRQPGTPKPSRGQLQRLHALVASLAAVAVAACGALVTEPAEQGTGVLARGPHCQPFYQWTTPEMTPAACKDSMALAGIDTSGARWGKAL